MSGHRCCRSQFNCPVTSLAVLALTCLALSIPLDSAIAQRVDCRKFVFAPSCRGVAAKRNAMEPVTRADGEGADVLSKILGVSDYPTAVRISSSDEEVVQEEERVEEEEDDVEEQDEMEEMEDEGRKMLRGETDIRRPLRGNRLGFQGWLGRRSQKPDRHQERFRKSDPALGLKPSYRKETKLPAAYDWFSSNDKRRQRNKGSRRHSPSKNYDY